MSKFQIGDIVKGNEKSDANYGITNSEMTEGRVIAVSGSKIKVKVLQHTNSGEIGEKYLGLDEDCFDFIRHEDVIAGDRLQNILDLHKKYLAGEDGGKCANLSGANLSDAYLSDADLRDADLSGADLSGAKSLLSSIGFIDAHFERTDKGYIAYKTFNSVHPAPESWKIEPNSVIEEVVNPCRTVDCGCGINVAPLDWVKRSNNGEVWKVMIEWPWLAGVIVPYGSDGKIRCEKVRLLEIVK